jgi:hypothetical protein
MVLAVRFLCALVAAIAAVLLAGCTLLPPPAGIQVVIPGGSEIPGGPQIPALPVTIVDHADIVRDVSPGVPVADVSAEQPVHAVPGREDAVALAWLGGECDDRAIITIDADGDRYRVTIESQSLATSCSAVGIIRTLLVELTKPVGADAFEPG